MGRLRAHSASVSVDQSIHVLRWPVQVRHALHGAGLGNLWGEDDLVVKCILLLLGHNGPGAPRARNHADGIQLDK